MSFRTIAKLGLVLVVIGFFMPVACGYDGFELGKFFMNNNKVLQGLLTYLLFGSAVVGFVLGVLAFTGKVDLGVKIDWIVVIVCVASGLIVYLSTALSDSNVKLQNGAFFILAGWIVSLGLLIFSKMKGES